MLPFSTSKAICSSNGLLGRTIQFALSDRHEGMTLNHLSHVLLRVGLVRQYRACFIAKLILASGAQELRIVSARSKDEIGDIRRLFLEYAQSLNIDLAFQHFEEEVATLPGDYAPPSGILLLAKEGSHPVGCVAVRRITDTVCEMKRLYVLPKHRGIGLGRKIASTAIDAARDLGYHRMRLDTLPSMKEAIGLYQSLGFKSISPYRHNPIRGTRYLELALD